MALDTLKSTGIVDQGCPCCGSSLHEGLAVNSISGRVASCLFERKSWSFSGLGHAVSQQQLHNLTCGRVRRRSPDHNASYTRRARVRCDPPETR